MINCAALVETSDESMYWRHGIIWNVSYIVATESESQILQLATVLAIKCVQ